MIQTKRSGYYRVQIYQFLFECFILSNIVYATFCANLPILPKKKLCKGLLETLQK